MQLQQCSQACISTQGHLTLVPILLSAIAFGGELISQFIFLWTFLPKFIGKAKMEL